MSYDIKKGLMQEGSLTAKIYFLLLKRKLSPTEISKVIYKDDKVQLSNILKALDKLCYKGYVREVFLSKLEKEQEGIDKRADLYQSTNKPVLEYIEKKVKWRKETSHSKHKEELTIEDKQVLELIFNSKWFFKFYSEGFLATQIGEIMKAKNGEIISHCPIRFFAFFLEELFEISFLLQKNFTGYKIKNEDILDSKDFDSFIEKNKNRITDNDLRSLHKINSIVVKSLGYYKEKNSFDYYTADAGILFIPLSLSEKLSSIGRVPKTVSDYFSKAIIKVKKKNAKP